VVTILAIYRKALNLKQWCSRPRLARQMLLKVRPAEAGELNSRRGKQMNNLFLSLYVKLQTLTAREEGQDLVEYALLVALIALVCIGGVSKVATAVNTVFSNISTSLA
jgi:pilus assembly protein Flp/PilA